MKRRAEQDDGFDFLLDTMTNAFGGVLFLAILISVQLQDRTVSQLQETKSSLQSERLSDEAQECQAEIAELAELVDREKDRQNKLVADSGSLDLSQLKRLQASVQSLSARVAAEERRIGQAETQIAELDAQRPNLNILAKTLREKQEELEKIGHERTVDGKLPRLQATSKREFQVVLRYGRVYSMRHRNGEFNVRDFFAEENATRIRLKPKPYRGLDLSSSVDGDGVLKVIPVSQRTHYLAVTVWEDSFDEFAKLKKQLARVRFPYALFLRRIGEPIESGGSGSDVVIPGA